MTDLATPPSATTALPQGLAKRVVEHGNRVHKRLVAAGDQAAADRVAAEARRWRTPETTVVVVGETKRGKSSLLNALLGRPLLPVDVDVATAVHLLVRQGAPEAVLVHREDAPPETVALDRLADFASESGPQNLRADVRSVEVLVDHPLLAGGLQLVDTPGVGGLTALHTELTLSTLPLADALLFVVDAGAPISRPELDFLERAADRVATVVFALTKVDAYRGWEQIRDATLELIAREVPRLADAPILPVSSKLRTRAEERRALGREDAAARLDAQSGFGPLVTMLEASMASRELLRLANIVEVTSRSAEELRRAAEDRRAAADGDPGAADRVEGEQAALAEAMSSSARWRGDFTMQFQRLSMGIQHDTARRFGDLDQHFGERTDVRTGASATDLEQLPAELDQAVQAVWVGVATHARDAFTELAAGLARTLELEGVAVAMGDFAVPERVRALANRQAAKVSGAEDIVKSGFPMTIGGYAFGSMIAGLGLVALPVGIGLGAAITGFIAIGNLRASRGAKGRQEFIRLVRETLGAARTECNQTMSLELLSVRQQIESQVDLRMDERRRTLDTRRRELADLARRAATERKRTEAEAAKQLDDARQLELAGTELRRTVHDLLVRMGTDHEQIATTSDPSGPDET